MTVIPGHVPLAGSPEYFVLSDLRSTPIKGRFSPVFAGAAFGRGNGRAQHKLQTQQIGQYQQALKADRAGVGFQRRKAVLTDPLARPGLALREFQRLAPVTQISPGLFRV